MGYLSVDEAALEACRAEASDLFAVESAHEREIPAADAFRLAVTRFVAPNDRVDMASLRGWVVDTSPGAGEENRAQVPRGLAFLAATVLAATQMQRAENSGQKTSSNDYFSRLCEWLDVEPGEGSNRPAGLEKPQNRPAPEEVLWASWNQYLALNSFLPTARAGEGSQRFVHYPVGQAMLRGSDRDRLTRFFQTQSWPRTLDPRTLKTRLLMREAGLTRHLHELFEDGRADGAIDAIHDLFESTAYTGSGAKIGEPRAENEAEITRSLFCDLGRRQGWLGGATYSLAPRRKLRDHATGGTLLWNEEEHVLEALGARRFASIGPLDAETLERGAQLEIANSSYSQAVFSARPFYILVQDAENEGSGEFGSWNAPRWGERFVILAQKRVVDVLESVRGALLQWDGEPREVELEKMENWRELHDCLLLSNDWSGLDGFDAELREALSSRETLSLSLTGGLRAKNGAANAYLAGHGPKISTLRPLRDGEVVGVDISVSRLDQGVETPIFSAQSRIGWVCEAPWDDPGSYLVRANASGTSGAGMSAGTGEVARVVTLLPWDSVEAAAPLPAGEAKGDKRPGPRWSQFALCGAARWEDAIEAGEAR